MGQRDREEAGNGKWKRGAWKNERGEGTRVK